MSIITSTGGGAKKTEAVTPFRPQPRRVSNLPNLKDLFYLEVFFRQATDIEMTSKERKNLTNGVNSNNNA